MSRELFYQDLREISQSLKEYRETLIAQGLASDAEFKKRAEEREADLKKRAEEREADLKKLDEEFKKRAEEREADLKKLDEEFKRRDEEREKEDAKRKAEFDEFWRKISGEWGRQQNGLGEMAEQYFINSIKCGLGNFLGEKFDEILPNVEGEVVGYMDEYDILLINGKSVAIIEVKFRACARDIKKVLRKAETFRVNFPKYANHKIYLGLASMSFNEESESMCLEKGIAVIKQVGDTLVIYDERIKAH